MSRWLPLGRDLTQTLNLYGYILAYVHKGIAWVFPNITLYHVTIYTPVVCFCLGLGALCLFFYRTFGILFSSIVGVLLATLLARSPAALPVLVIETAGVSCLASSPSQPISLHCDHNSPRKCLLWTLASGFAMFLGGVSWEGFGVFLSIILLVEIWRFLTSEIEDRLGLYLIWTCTFVPPLYPCIPCLSKRAGICDAHCCLDARASARPFSYPLPPPSSHHKASLC